MGIRVDEVTNASQLRSVQRVRYRVYCEEKHLFASLANDEAELLSDPADADARLFLAENNGVPIGTIRLLWGAEARFGAPEEANFSLQPFVEIAGSRRVCILGRFMVLPEHRAGVASALLLQAAATFAFSHGIDIGFCDCEPHLVSFYERLGFRAYRSVFNDPEFGVKVPLVAIVSDRAHLERVDSLLLHLLPDDFPQHAEPELLQLVGPNASSGRDRLEQVARSLADAEMQRPQVLDGLSEDEIGELLKRASVVAFEPGDLLIKEGHSSRTVWVLLEGTVEVLHDARVVAVAAKGDVVGELAMLLDRDRTAVVRAVTPGRALTLSDRTIQALVAARPSLAAKFLLNLAAHLGEKLLRLSAS